MFKRIAPQKAEDSEGFIVQVGDRFSVEYIEGDLRAEMEVEFGPITAIYPSKLTVQRKDGTPLELAPEQIALIIKRIENGLKFLGVKFKAYES